MDEGIVIYLGTTGTGKTYSAIQQITALHESTADRGCIVVDSAASPTLAHIPRVPSLEVAVKEAWGGRRMVRWIPSDEGEQDSDADFTRLMKAAREGGNIRLLIDEASFWYRNPQLLKLVRVWRASNVTLYFTGQTIGQDFGQGVLGCNPKFYVYRVTAPRTIEFCEQFLHFDRSDLQVLQLGECLEARL